jgi:hypothetical protein
MWRDKDMLRTIVIYSLIFSIGLINTPLIYALEGTVTIREAYFKEKGFYWEDASEVEQQEFIEAYQAKKTAALKEKAKLDRKEQQAELLKQRQQQQAANEKLRKQRQADRTAKDKEMKDAKKNKNMRKQFDEIKKKRIKDEARRRQEEAKQRQSEARRKQMERKNKSR